MFYQEDSSSIFEHDGGMYSLNVALMVTQNKALQCFEVKDLSWVLEYTSVCPVRKEKADLSAPILIAHWNNQLVVLDGAHRLAKAVDTGVTCLIGYLLSEQDLATAKLSN